MSDCCDDPRPRFSDRSGRLFCASCRRFLDHTVAAPGPLSAEETSHAGKAPSPQDDPAEPVLDPQEGDPT